MRFLNYKARMSKRMNCREKLCTHAAVTLRSPLTTAYCPSEKARKSENSLQNRRQGLYKGAAEWRRPKSLQVQLEVWAVSRVSHGCVCSRTWENREICVLSWHKVQGAEWHSDQHLWVTAASPATPDTTNSPNTTSSSHWIPGSRRFPLVFKKWQLPLPPLGISHRQAKSKPKQNQGETNVIL